MNTQITLGDIPKGQLTPAAFIRKEVPVPTEADLKDGQVLCEGMCITMGAGQRAGLQGSAKYAGAQSNEKGIVMGGNGIARVRASKDASIKVGTLVDCPSGWQKWSVHKASSVQVCEEFTGALADPAVHIGLFGVNGLTAWFLFHELGKPKAGETVLVSAAGGSVGHVVCQLAKAVGCKVVAVAGSDEKLAKLKALGIDETVNYKNTDFRNQLKTAVGKGADIYFDNVGGDILQAALFNMAQGGRLVCCGNASQYDVANPGGGPRGVPGLFVNKRLTMQGATVYEWRSQFAEAKKKMKDLADAGKLTCWLEEVKGLENAPQAFCDMLHGGTTGSIVVRI